MLRFSTLAMLVAAVAFWPGHTTASPITLGFDPTDSTLTQGGEVSVDVVADVPHPVIAFGFDVRFDNTRLGFVDVLFAPGWAPVPPPGPPVSDGTGFSALLSPFGPPGGASGSVTLLTLTFVGLSPGLVPLTFDITPGDLSEGFALATGGFADVRPGQADLAVLPRAVPEPELALLMLIGAGLLAATRAQPHRARARSFSDDN